MLNLPTARCAALILVASGAMASIGFAATQSGDLGVTALPQRFAGFDQNGDGQIELETVSSLHVQGTTGAKVLVLVEERLTQAAPGQRDLLAGLVQLTDDLSAEGYAAELVSVGLGASDLHQDGRYVLAIRELLRAYADEGELAGALLVGHFPDALLIRTVNWRKKGNVNLHGKSDEKASYKNKRYLRRWPEIVAHRADIVLADLDGSWEDLYFQPKTTLTRTIAVFEDGIPTAGGPVLDVEERSASYRDFFHISDGKLEVFEQPDDAQFPFRIFLDDRSADHEVSGSESDRPNVLSRPDIFVSRIDARGTAWSAKTSVLGAAGEGLLDATGQPQTVAFATKDDVPHWRDGIWQPDEDLERELLQQYLDRNHAYRTGTASVAFRPASLACDLGSGYSIASTAASDWIDADKSNLDVKGQPRLNQVAEWFAAPALFRTIRAHSDGSGSVFRKSKDLDEHLGGPAWSWSPKGASLVPSLSKPTSGGRLDWFLLHSLWRNGAVAKEPSIYLHTGCEIVSPPGATKYAFDDPKYGRRQAAEAVLFFGEGLALVGRAKVFYDEPKGFSDELASGHTVGDAWARYFDEESKAKTWGKAGGDIGRKRSYFWSVLGDWSLRLSPVPE